MSIKKKTIAIYRKKV